MSISRDGPNPLRPYYRPPSIGIPDEVPGISGATHGLGTKSGSAAAYASSARDMFDYSDYLVDSSPSSVEAVRRTLDDWLYKYFSVLLAQPFDVAKLVLQVKSQEVVDVKTQGSVAEIRSGSSNYRDSVYSDYPSDDSDPDEPTYFTPVTPSATSYSPSRSQRQRASNRDSPPFPKAHSAPSHQLVLKRPDSLLEVISQEWTKEGAWGVWKGSNATFLYNLVLQTIEQWSRGVFSAILNVPEAGAAVSSGLGDSPYPWASLAVTVAAAVSASLLLAPLDLIRTKLILTPISTPKRSLVHNIRVIPSYICPPTLIVPTILHSLIAPTISHSTPLLLRSHLGVDPVLTPTTYSVANFLSRAAELFLRLPLETVLRRGQASVLASSTYSTIDLKSPQTIVEVGPYNGVLGTMWSIVKEEGGSTDQEPISGTSGGRSVRRVKKTEQKGQGIEGLWRGWRVGMWGLVGMWGAGAMGRSGANTGEF